MEKAGKTTKLKCKKLEHSSPHLSHWTTGSLEKQNPLRHRRLILVIGFNFLLNQEQLSQDAK